MRFLVTPVGSAGDVHPFLGIARELAARGHQVAFFTTEFFRDHVQPPLEYVELGTREEYLAAAGNADLWHPRRAFGHIFRSVGRTLLRRQFDAVRERHVPGETIVVASCLGFGARVVNEAIGVPLAMLHLQPGVLWSNYESPRLPGTPRGFPRWPRWLKGAMFRCGEKLMMDRAACGDLNSFRGELGLPPMKRIARWWNSPDLNVGLFPEWYCRIQPDWPANVRLTHFPVWDVPEPETAGADLEEYLAAGDPPIVFTPGSAMLMGREFFAAAADACRRLNRRGLLLSRFGEQIPGDLPAGVIHFEYVPFAGLLPRSAAVVHHGGIGSTAQGMKAGVPQLLMPMAHDQPDNAARIARLGVGRSLPPRAFRGPAVAKELAELLESNDVQQACREVAGRFEGRSGVTETCDILESFAANRTPLAAGEEA